MAGNKDLIRHMKVSAFGDQMSVSPTQIAIATFPYGVLEGVVSSGLGGAGTLTSESGMAVLSTGASTASSGMIKTTQSLRYVPGQGGLFLGTCIFTSGVDGSTQVFGIGDELDGFFFGYNGDQFGICKRRNGEEQWIYQEDWDDPCDDTVAFPTMDWTKGNIFQIQYQWLGFGAIRFGLENPETGKVAVVHTIDYANANPMPSILNPTLPCWAHAANTTNNTDIVMKMPCLAGFIEGEPAIVGVSNSVEGSKTGITTETNILTIRNKTTFKGQKNRSHVRLLLVSAGVESNKPVIVRVYINATLGGSPSFGDVGPNSMIEYDTAGTTVTGGNKIISQALGRTGNFFIQSSPNTYLVLPPGYTATISAESTGATDASVSLTWREEY
jgi:hypothetical protein